MPSLLIYASLFLIKIVEDRGQGRALWKSYCQVCWLGDPVCKSHGYLSFLEGRGKPSCEYQTEAVLCKEFHLLIYQLPPFVITIIIIIRRRRRRMMIIAFKGANRDFFFFFFFFFYKLLTAPRTVSNTYVQVARAQSCANHVQHIKRLSRTTCRVTCHVAGRSSSAMKLDRIEIAFI